MLTVFLKPGKEKPIQNGHPWIFSQAIERIEGKPVPGSLCIVKAHDSSIIGTGYHNEHSSICVRMLNRTGAGFGAIELKSRITTALALRTKLFNNSQTTSFRLINAEGDFLPGLIVDKYSDGLCIQIGTAGMERFRNDIISVLTALCAPKFMYERSDTDSAGREGLKERNGCIAGELPNPLTVQENGLLYMVDLPAGQKSGFFIDQRENRMLLRKYASGAHVCDCFCYSGGFALNALHAGAKLVHCIDSSKGALALAYQNRTLNGLPAVSDEFIVTDVFDYLRKTTTEYDCIILDPPKFAKHKGEVMRASRGYKDINLAAMKKIKSSGILFTFSCSQAIDRTLFTQIAFAAAADAGRDIQILHVLGQPADHPVNIAHREGEYLKGLVLRVN